MADFHFDDTKTFDDNCAAFIARAQAIDAEMAAILKANWSMLADIVREGERDPKARATFNTTIADALDELTTISQAGKEE